MLPRDSLPTSFTCKNVGEAIMSFLGGGVKTTPSYRELERQTGRGDDSLKQWHDLYKKYPDKEEYIEKITGNTCLFCKLTA